MRKPTFCICENKDADQLRGNREADQRLCFRYTYRTIPLLSKSEISSLYLSSVAYQNVGFLMARLMWFLFFRIVLGIGCVILIDPPYINLD